MIPEATPPRLAGWVIRLTMRHCAWLETALGDLNEEFAGVVARHGRRAGARWYWRQALGLALQVPFAALARAGMAGWRRTRITLGDRPMRSLLHDTRIAVRTVTRRPIVALVIVGTLALGLGANAAVFAMADALWFRPFPIAGVDRIAMLSENSTRDPEAQESVSPANFLDWKHQSDVFRRMAAVQWWDATVSGTDEPERLRGSFVSADFFPMLGMIPARGRVFDHDDETAGHNKRVVLSDAVWHRRFGADLQLVGRTVRFNGESYDVIGIAPPGFEFPEGTQVWAPLVFTPEEAHERTKRYLTAIAQLKPGKTFDEARAQMAVIGDRLAQQYPEANSSRSLRVRTMLEGYIDAQMPQILGLWQTAALLVLIIACTNVAGLLLARGAERQRELALRLAIGASRWSIVRQLLLENIVLALAAVPLAMGVAWLGLQVCRAAMPAQIARFVLGWNQMYVSPRLFAATVAAALLTALIFGLLPALQTSRPDLVTSLKDGGRSASAGRARSRLRRGLVIAEIALALPLLVCSGLAGIGTYRLLHGPQGYNPDGLLVAHMVLPDATFPTDDAKRQFVTRTLERVSGVPGVSAAATINRAPAGPGGSQRAIYVEGQPAISASDERPSVSYRPISSGYLGVMQIPLVKGRTFSSADSETSPPVAIITSSMAAKFWPGEEAIGKRLQVGKATEWTTVVGVSADTIDNWFDRRNTPMLYVPVTQHPDFDVALVVRTSGDPASLTSAIAHAIHAIEPTQAVFDVMTMREQLSQRTIGLQFISGVMATFGGLALVLAAVGVYGVMSYYVAQRSHEIGVRMALGATATDVLRMTTGQAGRMSLIGIAIGLALAVALARVMQSALLGVISFEPWLLVATPAVLCAAALLAGVIPARRASLIDPASALRAD